MTAGDAEHCQSTVQQLADNYVQEQAQLLQAALEPQEEEQVGHKAGRGRRR